MHTCGKGKVILSDSVASAIIAIIVPSVDDEAAKGQGSAEIAFSERLDMLSEARENKLLAFKDEMALLFKL